MVQEEAVSLRERVATRSGKGQGVGSSTQPSEVSQPSHTLILLQ